MYVRSNSPLQNPPEDYCPLDSELWFVIPTGPDKGKRLFYYDYTHGDGTPDTVVLFVHGNPESSYTFRHVFESLLTSNKTFRIIAPDHIGFGLSDQATYEMVEMHHANNLFYLLASLDLTSVALVVHDWGGPIGIGAFIRSPERVKSLVLLNTTVFPIPDDGLTYSNFPIPWLPWASLPSFIPDVLWGGLAGYVVSGKMPQNNVTLLALFTIHLFRHFFKLYKPDSAEYVWSEQFRSIANTRSSKRMVRQTSVWGHGYEYTDADLGLQSNKDFYKTIQENISTWWGAGGTNIPVAGFFGTNDPCGKDSVIKQWKDALPQMDKETHTYPRESHFIEEYKGDEIGQAIIRLNGL